METRIGYFSGAVDASASTHEHALRFARMHCEHLIAAVPSDELLRASGIRHSAPLAQRTASARNLPFVDDVYVQSTLSPMIAWRDLSFTHLFTTDDAGAENARQLTQQFAAVGVRVINVPRSVPRISTALWRAIDAVTKNALAVVG